MSSCSSQNNHIDMHSLKFKSDCDEKTFCSAPENGSCTPRACRRDEFPFGYSSLEVLPPLCPSGTFCPDEGNLCLPLVAVGQPCQLNRDEQCAPPPTNLNTDQVLCLNYVCTYATIALGGPCVAENTTFTDVFDGQHFRSVFIKDNCQQPDLYCGQATMVCENVKQVGEVCQSDHECRTKTCEGQICMMPPETPLVIQTWQIILTVACIVGVVVSIILMLTLLHKQQRLKRCRELRGYNEEQLRLRQSLFALHRSAAVSYSSYADKRLY